MKRPDCGTSKSTLLHCLYHMGEILMKCMVKNKPDKITATGMMKISLLSLGLENYVEHFRIEATLCKPTRYQFPYALFRTAYPEGTAHMFCDFIRKK